MAEATSSPLDPPRLDAILRNAEELKASLPAGAGVAPRLFNDFSRLAWLWYLVSGVTAPSAGEWVTAARAELERTAAFYRSLTMLPGRGAAAEAERMAGVADAELAAVGARAREVAAFFEFLHRREGPAPTELRPGDPEAREWLRAGAGATGLAENWFEGPEDALEFVGRLYEAGAERVVVASESVRREGAREHADAVRVVLPADAARRSAVFELVRREMPQDGHDPEADAGQPVLFLWWD